MMLVCNRSGIWPEVTFCPLRVASHMANPWITRGCKEQWQPWITRTMAAIQWQPAGSQMAMLSPLPPLQVRARHLQAIGEQTGERQHKCEGQILVCYKLKK